MRIILASVSPRRKELLSDIVKDFEVIASNADETVARPMPSSRYPIALAERKARTVFDNIQGDCLVIGADTVVVIDGEIMNKPKDIEQAFDMLKKLNNRKHYVYTGVCVIVRKGERVQSRKFTAKTSVSILAKTEKLLYNYVETCRPLDKAGAYGIQELDNNGIDYIYRGSYSNVVGLPIEKLDRLLNRLRRR